MPPSHPTVLPPKRERILLWLLALTQFTVIMDFMVMMPLSPQLMRAFAIGPAAVSGAVSAYAWCAGLSGLFAAVYIDRYDRKRVLLTVFCLFALSNLGCALAPNFHALVLARCFAGLTGGVLSAVVMAIVGDVIPPERRGTATGIVMTSFGMAAVAGVPTGVVLGAHFGWASPFFLLVLLSLLIWCCAALVLPSLTAHLGARVRALGDVLPDLLALLRVADHRRAFLLSCVNMSAGMMVIPFIAPVLVGNHGVSPAEMGWVYLSGGCATLFTARMIGRWSDRFGKHRVYTWVAGASLLPILALTHLPALPFAGIIACFVCFMVVVSGRMIPMQALLTTVPEPAHRGAFMSVNSAIQQLGSGLGAWIGGLGLQTDAAGHIAGYGNNGWTAAALTLFAVFWVQQVRSNAAEARGAPAASGAQAK